MWKYTVGIDGMMCGMCENHMNEAVRNAMKVKKVTSSHSKKETVILTEEELNEEAMNKIVEPTGYKVTSFVKEEYKRKGLFGR